DVGVRQALAVGVQRHHQPGQAEAEIPDRGSEKKEGMLHGLPGTIMAPGRKLAAAVSTNAHAPPPRPPGLPLDDPDPGWKIRCRLGRPYRRAGRALPLGGLLELPARRPLALGPRAGRLRARPGGPDRAARGLLGLHRLEGSLGQARVLPAPAQALAVAED